MDDLADVWCAYAQMELRKKQYARALQVLQRATTVPGKPPLDDAGKPTVQVSVTKASSASSLRPTIASPLFFLYLRSCRRPCRP